MLYFRSRKRLSETIENESTMPPVISGVSSRDLAVVVLLEVLLHDVVADHSLLIVHVAPPVRLSASLGSQERQLTAARGLRRSTARRAGDALEL